MYLISFDIGAKNLAYCLLKIENNDYKIIKWDVIDICVSNEKLSCCYLNCKTNPKYKKEEKMYCLRHAKQYNKYIVPPKHKKLDKMKLEELKEFYEEIFIKNKNIFIDELNKEKKIEKKLRKSDIIELINKELKDHYYEELLKEKAANVSLVTMGKNMKLKLDKSLEGLVIETVLIENQISPLANRMKTLQGMVAQYFIMNDSETIEFISSSNKLKDFTTKKTNYKERKKMSIEIVKDLLNKKENIELNFFEKNKLEEVNKPNWLYIFENHKKKDDLADSLLQGLWYIKNKL
jgi:hypothetical protein